MYQKSLVRAVLPLAFLCTPVAAQDVTAPPAPVVSAAVTSIETPATACCVAAAGTVIDLEVVPLLSTKTVKRGDKFEIRLAEPIVLEGQTLLPAGVTGLGEVVHAAGSSFGGKPGELILAARFLQHGDQRIPLKGMKLGVAGRDNAALALAGSMVVGLLMFIPGGEVQLPAGSRANAKLAADVTLSPIAPAPPQPLSPSAAPASDATP